MPRVLIITYYWPPCGGAGVQRWLKFVKYLPQCGWEPVIYTPENPEMPVVDESLLNEIPNGITILKKPVWEPYNIYKKFVGRKKHETINPAFLSEKRNPALAEKLAVWIRGNIFIPDARMFWVKPSVEYLYEYIALNPIDCIISSGPPHSMHLIGLELKRRWKLPWIADFRDLWTMNDYYDQLMLTPVAKFLHRRMEKKVLAAADIVLTIGNKMKEDLIASGSRRTEVITNGFDENDFPHSEVETDKKFTISHIGTLVKTRNPELLWKVLSELVQQGNEFSGALEIKLIGKVDVTVMDSISQYGLTGFVRKTEYLPHKEVLEEMMKSQVLLLLINRTANAEGILTGKFFEYLAACRPVLAIGPPSGDAASVLNETNAGKVCDFDDETALRSVLLGYFELYRKNHLVWNGKNIEKYSRQTLAQRLGEILNNITGQTGR